MKVLNENMNTGQHNLPQQVDQFVIMVCTPAALPQVAGSTPSGSEFRLRVKKSPSLVPCAKALAVAARPACGNGDTGNGGPAQGGNGAPAVSRPR
jgi:hypothetical protein